MRRFTAAGLLAFAACAGAPSKAPDFPIGVYGADRPEDLAALAAAGFDAFHTDAQTFLDLEPLAREALRRRMWMLAFPDRIRDSVPAAATRDWPVAAWYIKDEPDVAGMSPQELSEISHKTTLWDPRRGQTFAIGIGSAAERFGATADTVMLDWYPVPHLPLDSVAEQMDRARGHLPEGKPLWMVIQAFDWRNYRQADPSKPRIGRFPTSEEIRFMSYLAVLHGARGLFFFTLKKPGGATLLDSPPEWGALSRVAKELRALAPFPRLLRRTDPAGEGKGLEWATWTKGGDSFAIVLNRRNDGPLPLPRELTEAGWRPVFEAGQSLGEVLEAEGDKLLLPPSRVVVLNRRPPAGSGKGRRR